ncbi:MAG: TetR family transcriptional regulator [Acidimicrobiales bacterium]|nr:MAG: TetR family transcriptional regulator [Acidimicrobiales bacterium]
MSGVPNIDRQAARRTKTSEEIVAAAWVLAREEGLTGIAMRDLGARVGMRAQSLYSYFSSKHEIYDAMFLDGYLAFADMVETGAAAAVDSDPETILKRAAREFVTFCTSDPARYQLLFHRAVPGFEPSPASWNVALAAYERSRESLSAAGITDQASFDIWTALVTGLAGQQIANDPGGDRWERLVDRSVDMFRAHIRENARSESEHA